MTLEEKIDILSLNFSILWYRIWLSNPEQNYNFYNIYDNNTIFCNDDNNRINKQKENNTMNSKNQLASDNIDLSNSHEIYNSNNNKKNYTGTSTYISNIASSSFKQPETDQSLEILQNNTFYYKKKYIFESTFLKDNGKKLKKIICSSINSFLEWEIPKGGKLSKESELLCASRELEEETNIKTTDYSVLYNQGYITCSNIDYKTTYITNYYIGFLKNKSSYNPVIKFNNIYQISEVSDIKWFSLNDVIKMTNHNQKHQYLYNSSGNLSNIFKKVIIKFKDNIKS
jgi:8-oxo-dGTP pyrophosphatase MutT (NUDIX family)